MSGKLEQNQLVSTKQMGYIVVIHQFPWVLVWVVFWTYGPVLGYCGIACGF